MIHLEEATNFFPEEIIIEIISKLPAKSVGRLKRVCKSWCSLISSPQFMKKHVRVGATEALHCLHCICEKRFFPSFGRSYNLTPGSYAQIKRIGSCNGLVCLCINKSVLFLWNPCTGEKIRIKESSCSKDNSSTTRYAFCYHQEFDDYKVVKLNTDYKQSIKIYSLRNDSWTSIDCSRFGVDRLEPSVFAGVKSSVFVGGALIWGVPGGFDNCLTIVSLDLKTKRLLKIPQPNYEDSSTSNQLLKAFDGCLCVLCETSKICVDIWVMKKHGVRDSWVKMVTVPYPTELISNFGDPKIKTLCNSGVLMHFGKKRMYFSFEKNSFNAAPDIGVQEFCDGAGTFMETIVSPRAYKGIGFDHLDHF